jgi:uncharacterized protein YwqG
MPGRSYLGGLPQVTTPFVWPVHDNRPLDFIAQINLRDLARCHRFDWLPDSGTLLFFERAWVVLQCH